MRKTHYRPPSPSTKRNAQRHKDIQSQNSETPTVGAETARTRSAGAVRGAWMACAIAALAVTGCQGPAADPVAPSGGRAYVLDYASFATVVDPILSAHGCDNLNCHGGGIRGTFELSPANDKDMTLDFTQSCLQVNPSDFEASSLLAKPLAESAGGMAHAGDSPTVSFASRDDPDYQAILAWIMAGEYK